jgi:hypothetical protein
MCKSVWGDGGFRQSATGHCVLDRACISLCKGSPGRPSVLSLQLVGTVRNEWSRGTVKVSEVDESMSSWTTTVQAPDRSCNGSRSIGHKVQESPCASDIISVQAPFGRPSTEIRQSGCYPKTGRVVTSALSAIIDHRHYYPSNNLYQSYGWNP